MSNDRTRAALYRNEQRGRLRRQDVGPGGQPLLVLVGGGFASVVTLLLLFSVGAGASSARSCRPSIPLALALSTSSASARASHPATTLDLCGLWLKGPGFGPNPPAAISIRSLPTTMSPIDSMSESAPNGYFVRDLIVFNGLRKGGYVSKGFIFEPPDLNNAPSPSI